MNKDEPHFYRESVSSEGCEICGLWPGTLVHNTVYVHRHLHVKGTLLIDKLRTRAEIRRKATCRGPEDRLANELDGICDLTEELLKVLSIE
jgi:hypothetical protein